MVITEGEQLAPKKRRIKVGSVTSLNRLLEIDQSSIPNLLNLSPDETYLILDIYKKANPFGIILNTSRVQAIWRNLINNHGHEDGSTKYGRDMVLQGKESRQDFARKILLIRRNKNQALAAANRTTNGWADLTGVVRLVVHSSPEEISDILNPVLGCQIDTTNPRIREIFGPGSIVPGSPWHPATFEFDIRKVQRNITE